MSAQRRPEHEYRSAPRAAAPWSVVRRPDVLQLPGMVGPEVRGAVTSARHGNPRRAGSAAKAERHQRRLYLWLT